jgi:hypothetical protein
MPLPTSTTTSGISATDGIGRRNSIVDAVSARSTGTAPMTTPTATPASTAIASPITHVRRVWPSAVQNRLSPV